MGFSSEKFCTAVVAGFLLPSASHSPSAIAELLVKVECSWDTVTSSFSSLWRFAYIMTAAYVNTSGKLANCSNVYLCHDTYCHAASTVDTVPGA